MLYLADHRAEIASLLDSDTLSEIDDGHVAIEFFSCNPAQYGPLNEFLGSSLDESGLLIQRDSNPFICVIEVRK